MGSILSGILGGGQSDAQAGQSAALQQARDAAHAYRPEAMQARLNLLNKASGAYQGMNNAMETMYGGRGPKVGNGGVGGAPQGPTEATPTFGGHPVPQQPQQSPMPQQSQGHQRQLAPGSAPGGWDPFGIFGGN
jgi:hypothetical protein